jgi:serine/threonine protein kinase
VISSNAVIGQQLLHYEILSRLGEGAAGAVYKARDTQGDRLVAICALPPKLSSDPERRRRVQEAVIAAAGVSHLNLARIYELASADGQDFIVSELVEGESLDTILRGGVCTALTCSLLRARSRALWRRSTTPVWCMAGCGRTA